MEVNGKNGTTILSVESPCVQQVSERTEVGRRNCEFKRKTDKIRGNKKMNLNEGKMLCEDALTGVGSLASRRSCCKFGLSERTDVMWLHDVCKK